MARGTLYHDRMEVPREVVAYWKKELESSIRFQQEEFLSRINYDELVRYYEGLQLPPGAQMGNLAIIDELSPAENSVLANIYYQDPGVTARPMHPKAEGRLRPNLLYLIQNPTYKPPTMQEVMESAIGYGMRKTEMKGEMQLAGFDLLNAGFTVCEMNHLCKAAPQPDEESLGVGGMMDKAMDAFGNAIGKVRDALTGTDQGEAQVVSEQGDKELIPGYKDATYCKRWHPNDILFDSRAKVFKESRFISKIVRMSLAEFREMYPHYKTEIPGALLSGYEYRSNMSQKHYKMVTLYELQVKKEDAVQVLVVADGIEEALDAYISPVTTNGFTLKYSSIDEYGKIYPMSRAKKAKMAQDNLNHYATIQFEHADRGLRKVAYWAGGLTPAGEVSLRSPDIYALVEKSVQGPVFETIPMNGESPESQVLQAMLQSSINKLFGTTESQKLGGSTNKFATQDAIENQAFQVNTSMVQDAMRKLAVQLLDTLKDIIMKFWDEADYFQITGKEGVTWYDPSMGPLTDLLLGDFLIDVDIVKAQRPNPMTDREDTTALAAFLTSPPTMAFLASKGKTPSIVAIENAIRSYNQNPDTVLEDLAPVQPPGSPLPAPPNQTPNPAGPMPTPGGSVPQYASDILGGEGAGI